ncbi:MAG: UDP-N-acetylmuramoyl-tripeptide--D-alanyl-D-alanine ligase [Succinivibrionaceae bacterium]|nr:UDP-N-acetylmuramoyl-tripeptide--D-alanyl-D-alanine ligase [Succinivibrionaceae bacterium]
MIDFSLSELARACSGTLSGADLTISRVSTDSRDCQGALFVALAGERRDAHDFIPDALANGAVALGVARGGGQAPTVTCPDTLRLLGEAGALVRRKSRARVLALTGTCGKTTVKELTLSIMSGVGEAMATAGNFNNDIGVPLTLLRIAPTTEWAIVEQGASHLKDIERTARYVDADVALINNIGEAHIEGFGSREGVFLGKSEILEAVDRRRGVGIVPADSPWLPRWESDFAAMRREGRLLTFGTAEGCFVRVQGIEDSGDDLSFVISSGGESAAVRLGMLGRHNALNAAAACALALAGGAPFAALSPGLARAGSVGGRLHKERLGDLTLIDDAYNASYNSVLAAIDVLSAQPGHRAMVFGDMGELGAEAVRLHEQVGEYARGRVDTLLCVGPLSGHTARAAGGMARHLPDREAALPALRAILAERGNCTVLVKGSHSMGLSQVCEALRAQGREEKC